MSREQSPSLNRALINSSSDEESCGSAECLSYARRSAVRSSSRPVEDGASNLPAEAGTDVDERTFVERGDGAGNAPYVDEQGEAQHVDDPRELAVIVYTGGYHLGLGGDNSRVDEQMTGEQMPPEVSVEQMMAEMAGSVFGQGEQLLSPLEQRLIDLSGSSSESSSDGVEVDEQELPSFHTVTPHERTTEEWLEILRGEPSMCEEASVYNLIECYNLRNIQFIVPQPADRPWRAPAGYFCVYESFFSLGLRFPLPKLFVDHCDECGCAFTQLAPSSIHNLTTFAWMVNECGVEVDVQLFEEVSTISRCTDYWGAYYVSMRPKYEIITGSPNKVYNWKRRFFYVKIDEASVLDVSRTYRREWNAWVDRHPVGRPFRDNFREEVERIRSFSHLQFPDILEKRLRRKVERAGAEDMYATRLREANKRKAEESARPGSSKRQNVEPCPDEPITAGAEKTPEQSRAAPRSSARSKGQAAASQSAQHAAQRGARPEEGARRELIHGDSARYPVPSREAVIGLTAAEKASGKRTQTDDLPSWVWPSTIAIPHYVEFKFDDEEHRFVTDRRACGELSYSVCNTDTSFPELDSLEEKETYLNYARSRLRSEAFLNQLIADYQIKLQEAREQAARTKGDERTKAELEKALNENKVLKSSMAEMSGKVVQLKKDVAGKDVDLNRVVSERDGHKTRYDKLRRSNDALKAKYEKLHASIVPITARLERLRLRLVYLEEVKEPLALRDQVQGTLECLKALMEGGIEAPEYTLKMMEGDLKTYELLVNETTVVELEAGDLAPELPEGGAK